jgi:hypothetical protein
MGGKGPSQSTQDTQAQITQEQISLAQQQDARSQKLFDLTEPGMKTAEDFYSALASGNPGSIQRASAPATQQIAQAYNSQIQNISQNMPRGGARDLAIQEAEISKSGAIGNTEAQAYLGSFPALASLAGQGIGLSVNEITQALAGFSGASQSNQALGQMQGAGKAETLGFIGSLGQSAATGAGLAMSCWISEAIFGKYNLRTARLRAWLNLVFGKTVRGRIVMFFYRHFGRWIARRMKTSTWMRRIFERIFRWFDRKAYEWELSQVDALRMAGVL